MATLLVAPLVSGCGYNSLVSADESVKAAWAQVENVKLGWGVFEKVLKVKAPAAGGTRKVTLGRFWMADNFGNAEGIAQTWQSSAQALPGRAAPNQLPQAAYG